METRKCYKRYKSKQNYTITNKTKGKKLDRNYRKATEQQKEETVDIRMCCNQEKIMKDEKCVACEKKIK